MNVIKKSAYVVVALCAILQGTGANAQQMNNRFEKPTGTISDFKSCKQNQDCPLGQNCINAFLKGAPHSVCARPTDLPAPQGR